MTRKEYFRRCHRKCSISGLHHSLRHMGGRLHQMSVRLKGQAGRISSPLDHCGSGPYSSGAWCRFVLAGRYSTQIPLGASTESLVIAYMDSIQTWQTSTTLRKGLGDVQTLFERMAVCQHQLSEFLTSVVWSWLMATTASQPFSMSGFPQGFRFRFGSESVKTADTGSGKCQSS